MFYVMETYANVCVLRAYSIPMSILDSHFVQAFENQHFFFFCFWFSQTICFYYIIYLFFSILAIITQQKKKTNTRNRKMFISVILKKIISFLLLLLPNFCLYFILKCYFHNKKMVRAISVKPVQTGMNLKCNKNYF